MGKQYIVTLLVVALVIVVGYVSLFQGFEGSGYTLTVKAIDSSTGYRPPGEKAPGFCRGDESPDSVRFFGYKN